MMKVDRSMTIHSLKCQYMEMNHVTPPTSRTYMPPPDPWLLFGGKKLEDAHILSECNIQEGSTLTVVWRMRGGRNSPISFTGINGHPRTIPFSDTVDRIPARLPQFLIFP